jgi:hypothetical protein
MDVMNDCPIHHSKCGFFPILSGYPGSIAGSAAPLMSQHVA